MKISKQACQSIVQKLNGQSFEIMGKSFYLVDTRGLERAQSTVI